MEREKQKQQINTTRLNGNNWHSQCAAVCTTLATPLRLHSELPVLEHILFFRMSHFPPCPTRLAAPSVSLACKALSCSYSCVLRATYFLQFYDNKLSQQFARSSTAHSSFSLPTGPLVSIPHTTLQRLSHPFVTFLPSL